MRVRPLAVLTLAASLAFGGVGVAAAAVDGPDVASYQHPGGAGISWSQVRASGRSFGIVKATEGSAYTNPYFAGDWRAIHAAGLVRGSYHYARPALPTSTAITQARRYVAVTGTTRERGDLPPILDIEESGGLAPGDLVTWTQVWLDTVRHLTGRTPVVYTYRWFWKTSTLDSTAFAGYPLWLADYTAGATAPATPLIGGWADWTLWQYTSSQPVPGIRSGGIDMSRYRGTATQLAAFASGAAARVAVTAPKPPAHVAAGPRDHGAMVTWVPGGNGFDPVQRYTVTAAPGGQSVTVGGTTTRARFTTLTNGTVYRFTVRAVNAVGAGTASAASNAVMPIVPTSFASSLSPTRLVYRGVATMSARLVRADTGAPLTGRTLTVLYRRHGTSTWTTPAHVTTDGTGTARWRFTPAWNADVAFRYDGPPGWQDRTTYARTVWVRAGVTTYLSASSTRVRRSVRMTGRVSPPVAGQLVLRQGLVNGAWHTWATGRTAADGTYAFTITPTLVATNYYRVVAAPVGGRSSGVSRTLTLRVS